MTKPPFEIDHHKPLDCERIALRLLESEQSFEAAMMEAEEVLEKARRYITICGKGDELLAAFRGLYRIAREAT